MFRIYSARTAALWRTCIGTISGAWSGDRRRDHANRDAIAITGCAAAVCLVEYHYDLAPMVLQFGIDYRDWEVDNLLFTLMVMSFALLIFGYRRVKDLSRAMRARKLAELDALRLARHDPLTGLPNRPHLYERLNSEIALAVLNGGLLGVVYIDLDGFKEVNDVHGHAAGDTVLQEVAARMAGIVRRGDTVGRIGGDEFVMVLPHLGSRSDAERIAAKITAGLQEPIFFNNQALLVDASIGISLCPLDGEDPDGLLKVADAQMYREKGTHKRPARTIRLLKH